MGYGFNSNGRYAQHGLLNERFIPRLAQAKPDTLLGDDGLLDPARCWAAMMANESRAVTASARCRWACSTWRCGMPSPRPSGCRCGKLLADRYNGGQHDDKAWVYAAGGYYYPGKDLAGLQDEMMALSRPRPAA